MGSSSGGSLHGGPSTVSQVRLCGAVCTDSLRFRSVCRSRFWRRRGYRHHFLLYHASCRPITLVGEYSVSQDCRRDGNASQTLAIFGILWATEREMGIDRYLRI